MDRCPYCGMVVEKTVYIADSPNSGLDYHFEFCWVERCPECEWWCKISDLVDDDGEPCPCSNCKPRGWDEEGDEADGVPV